jgi:asparagine N-glycosylation enzyme membrane subunit Stt3
MSILGLILLVVLVMLVLGGLPRWNHSREWGYGPSGGLGLLLVVVLVLVLMGHI